MQITHQKRGKYLLIQAAGRLDASWSDHFAETLLTHVRHGHHHLIIDGSKLSFLSSAGIRALAQVYKALRNVKGGFQIIHATSFVDNTLKTTGFGVWLAEKPPGDMPGDDAVEGDGIPDTIEVHLLDRDASLRLSVPAAWRPWRMVTPAEAVALQFGGMDFALGIASASGNFEEARDHFGEFMAVAGNVAYQPPKEGEHPDFLLSQGDFVPEMLCMQALQCTGKMSHLMRFAPAENKLFYGLGEIAGMAFKQVDAAALAFVLLGEIDGLVGSTLIRSPGLLTEDRSIPYPEIKEWISFCAERVYDGHQALIFGLASKNNAAGPVGLLPGVSTRAGLKMHAHATVFPYQPLQNGKIDLNTTIQRFFDGAPPVAMLHLVEDSRPAVGLGESALIRGACWFSPVNNPEGLL